jgi:hypothetical protein
MEQIRGPARALSVAGIYVDMKKKSLLSKAVTYKWAATQTDLNRVVGLKLNVNSAPQVQALLYQVFKLPVKKKRVPGKGEVITADDDALVSLLNYTKSKSDSVIKSTTKAKWNRMHLTIKLIRIIRRLRKRLSSYIDIKVSSDLRLRSIWKVSATETGRWACEKFVDGTGCNAQTFPREPLEIEDEIIRMIERGEI